MNFIAGKMTTFVNIPAGSEFPLQNLPYGIFSTSDNVSFLKLFVHIALKLDYYVKISRPKGESVVRLES